MYGFCCCCSALYAPLPLRLTFSEDLGDALTEHAQKTPGVADVCLALATVAYEACDLHGKVALSMCRRGLIHGAAEFMTHCEDLTAGQCACLAITVRTVVRRP